MTCHLARGLSLVSQAVVVLGFCSCSSEPPLPRNTVYRGIDGQPMVKIVSSTELELTKGSDRFVCAYSREQDRLRVVITVFGTKQAVYFTVIPDGLRDEDGTVLYRPGRYDEVMREVKAARQQRAVNDRLIEAARSNDPKSASAALRAGAQVDAVGEFTNLLGGTLHRSAIHFAADAGNTELLQLLLDSRANINNTRDDRGTPLMIAVLKENKDAVQLLVDRGADINVQDERGNTPLMIAFSQRNKAVVQLLVHAGADRSLRNREGQTVFDLAQGERDRQRWLQTKEEEVQRIAAERLTVATALRSGHPFFGEERSSGRRFPFQINFETFDDGSGHLAGTMNYYPSNDKAILTIDGLLEGAILKLSHTGTLQKGVSTPDYDYSFRLGDDEYLVGEYTHKGSTGQHGQVVIDLNEARRSEMEGKVVESVRQETRKVESRTASMVVARTSNSAWHPAGGETEVILTDVSIKGVFSGVAEERFFYSISKISTCYESPGGDRIIEIKGPAKGFGEYRREIRFRKNKGECDGFQRAIVDALEAWRAKYPEVVVTATD